jgi:hypothetical protein
MENGHTFEVSILEVESNATPFIMAHIIPFHELQARVALHIWPHSIKLSPDQSDPYGTPNTVSCNSHILSQNCMSKLTKEDDDASLIATENRIFDCFMDAMKYQSQAIYAFIDHILEVGGSSCSQLVQFL